MNIFEVISDRFQSYKNNDSFLEYMLTIISVNEQIHGCEIGFFVVEHWRYCEVLHGHT